MTEEGHRIAAAFIVQALADKYGFEKSEAVKRISIKNFNVTDGSKKGDNFACVMKAVTGEAVVDGETKAFDLMGKCIPMNPMREKWIVEVNIFKKEVLAYTIILPAFRKLQPDCVELGVPLCHFSEDKVMLMENLKRQGYKMVDKKIGLDLTHIQLLLGQLSLLHALSYHWIQTSPGGLDALRKDHPLFFHDDGWISHGSEEMKAQFDVNMTKMFESCSAIVEKYAPDRPHLAERMKKFSEIVAKTLDEVARPKPGQFCAILHGDCWNNNFMFLYDKDGKPTTMKIVDYQLMRYGCIAHDLVYFFGSSTSPEMRKEHLSDMLEYYHRRLTLHLSKLGYSESSYPFESFKKDVDDCYAFGYITGTFLAQVFFSEKAAQAGGTMDVDDCQTEEEMNKKMETYDKLLLNEADGNVPLQMRLIGLAEEAVVRGLI